MLLDDGLPQCFIKVFEILEKIIYVSKIFNLETCSVFIMFSISSSVASSCSDFLLNNGEQKKDKTAKMTAKISAVTFSDVV